MAHFRRTSRKIRSMEVGHSKNWKPVVADDRGRNTTYVVPPAQSRTSAP